MMGVELDKIDVHGAEEIDIVYTALDEIMTSAVRENWDFAIQKDLNFRDACLVRSMKKLQQHYKECGLTM
jgi:glutamate dehydrogenase/leucine dehydrogenase